MHLRRQVFHQGLQLTSELGRQIAAAVGVELEGLEQVAVELESNAPGRAARRIGQAQVTGGIQRPIAAGLQQTGEVQYQIVALQMHRVDLQAGGSPVRHQLQALEFFIAVEQQAANANIAQLERNRQLQVGQLNRPAVALFGTGGEFQADLFHIQSVDAQGHAQQAAG